MTRLLSERLPFALALLALSAVGPSALLHYLAEEPAAFSPGGHLVLVSLSAVGAAGTAVALTVVGVRRGDATTVLLGTAFTTMSALLGLHGVATPGVMIGENGLVAIAGALSLPVGSALLSLSAAEWLRGPRAIPRLLALQALLTGGVVVFGGVGLLAPQALPALPRPGSAPAVMLFVVGLWFFGGLAFRAASTFALTRRTSDLLVVFGTVSLAAALVPTLLLSPMTLAFYAGHGLELLGMLCVGLPLAIDLRRDAASRPLIGDLSAADLVLAEEHYLGARLRSLMVALEAKDASTEQHTRRVALLAVRIGEVFELSPARMRVLAVGGLLHDIGKLAVPDAALKKPGRLTDREFNQIKRHPAAGHALLGRVGGFSAPVRRLVRDHHERLDGAGYPRGRGGDSLDLETRILTVCDVYDALISDRVYRPAWTRSDALELLHRDAGTAFDAACVAALERVLGEERVAPEPGFVAGLGPASVPPPAPTPARRTAAH